MKLEQSFEVDAPLERVWNVLLDIERVTPCLPGAAVTGRREDGSYDGSFSVKIGPTTASYAGRLMLENVEESAHRATMQANGTDRRGQGGARARIVSTLQALDGRTRVTVDTDYQITGRLARFGRGGMIEDIAERLLREFAGNLQRLLGAEDSAAAPDAGREAPAGDGGAPSEVDARRDANTAPAPRPAPPAEPIRAGSLAASVAWARVRRNPAPVVAVVFLVLLAVMRRRR
jgi:carbon monoxide dehydrogenase subunit G